MPTGNVDALAKQLMYMGRLARRMPPAWDGAGISHPVLSPDLGTLGRMLPGRGFYCTEDLKNLGIKRMLPHVYEYSKTQKLVEAIRNSNRKRHSRWMSNPERGAISTYDGIISARGGGNAFDTTISLLSITTVANAYSSLFRAGGSVGTGAFTNIPTGAANTRASAGAWSQGLVNPTGGNKKYLLTLGYTAAQAINMMILVDLLVQAGNILLTSSAGQTTSTAALTRYTNGNGVMVTFVYTTQASATAHTITLTSYTNQAGTAAQASPAGTGINGGIIERLGPTDLGPFMQLQAGDFGVRAVQTVTIGTALVAGVIAINLYFPIAFIPGIGANVYVERDSTVQIDGLTELVQTAGNVLGCLTAYVMPNTTSTGVLTAFLRTADG